MSNEGYGKRYIPRRLKETMKGKMILDREDVKQEGTPAAGSPGIRVRDSRDRPLNFPSNLDVHDWRDAAAPCGCVVLTRDSG